jgi:hypothetical protein
MPIIPAPLTPSDAVRCTPMRRLSCGPGRTPSIAWRVRCAWRQPNSVWGACMENSNLSWAGGSESSKCIAFGPAQRLPLATVRLEFSAPFIESWNGKRQSFSGERYRKLQTHRSHGRWGHFHAPPCILHARFSVRNEQGSVRVASPPTADAGVCLQGLLRLRGETLHRRGELASGEERVRGSRPAKEASASKHHAFGLIGTALSKKIRAFPATLSREESLEL